MDLHTLTIKQAQDGLASKSFSAVELTKAYLSRIKQYDEVLNSYITVCEKEALSNAGRADELINDNQALPLLGMPIAFKDLYMTAGIRTTAASNVLSDYIAQYDATVVGKYKDAGALILGKTNQDAWAHGSSGENSDFGPTKNPYDISRIPGGSSSGSAAALAADLCIASTGTDTGGSIRQPASFTNVVGLKPTYGRVSRSGVIAMASSLDSIGHFTKTVEDSAILLGITAGHDPKDATTPEIKVDDYTKNLRKGVKGLKIGVPKEYFIPGMNKDIEATVRKSLKTFEKLGADIVEISLPHTEYAVACYYIIQPAEVSSNLARYDGVRFGNSRASFGDEAKRRIMLGTYTLSAGYYDAYYKKALQVRTLAKQDFDQAFAKVDAIVAPVSPSLPWKIGEKTNDPLAMYLEDVFTVTINLVGIPGLSVPAGFSNGLPIGIQILGPHFSESLLFQIGHAFEEETQYYKHKPVLV